MTTAIDLDDSTEYMPTQNEHFNQSAYTTALYYGYSDEEAYQIGSTEPEGSEIEPQYHYPDPSLCSEPVQANTEYCDRNMIKANAQTRPWNDILDVNTPEVGVRSAITVFEAESINDDRRTDRKALSTSDYKHSTSHPIPPTPELATSPVTSVSTASSCETPETIFTPPAALPDTYAGRRSTEGRSGFPRECGACGRRFLYEDSALKHYRKHHGEPPNIILRYNAPKRPPPGVPRSVKAAFGRARQSATPPATITSPHPVPPWNEVDLMEAKHSPDARYNDTSQNSPMSTTVTISSLCNGNSSDANQTIATTITGTDLVDDQVGKPQGYSTLELVIEPDSGFAYTKICDMNSNRENHLPAQRSPTGPEFSVHDARHAAVKARQGQSHTLPPTAQKAIARANPHLLQKRRKPFAANERPVAGTHDNSSARIGFLEAKVRDGECPPLPPEWAYDKDNTSLTFVPQFGTYYRRGLYGRWQRWSADASCWQD